MNTFQYKLFEVEQSFDAKKSMTPEYIMLHFIQSG